jgi:hypothetical protein
MFRFARRLLRTVTATRPGSESAARARDRPERLRPILRSLSQSWDPKQQSRDVVPTRESAAH